MSLNVTHNDIRRLLHELRRPHLSRSNGLAQALCEALNVATAMEAVSRLINVAFSPYGPTGVKLAELIRMSDLDGSLSQAGVAKQCGYSMRQYFRYRAQAIKLLTAEAQAVLSGVPVALPSAHEMGELAFLSNPRIALALYDCTTENVPPSHIVNRANALVAAGEILGDDFLGRCPPRLRPVVRIIQARSLQQAGQTKAAAMMLERLRSIAASPGADSYLAAEFAITSALAASQRDDAHSSLRELAGIAHVQDLDAVQRSRALLLQAEANVRLGRHGPAAETLLAAARIARKSGDLHTFGCIAFLSAQRAFATGETARCEELCASAAIALENFDAEYGMCQVLLGRARLALGKNWRAPELRRPDDAWDRLALQAVTARHFLRDARFAEAEEEASATYKRAAELGFTGIAAYTGAALGACAGVKQDAEQEQALYVEAWRMWARTGDVVLGADLFEVPARRAKTLGPVSLEQGVCDSLNGILAKLFPETSFQGDASSAACWYHAIRYANGSRDAASKLHHALASLKRPLSGEVLRRAGSLAAVFLPKDTREKWLSRWEDAFWESNLAQDNDAVLRAG